MRTPEQVRAEIIAKVTGVEPALQSAAFDNAMALAVHSIQAEAGDLFEGGERRAQPAQPEQFTSEELHNIRQLAIDKLTEINTSPFYSYVRSALPSIRNKAQAELERRGEWED